jgi:FtsP/CotA-like multicopper oxidase with cupredoxin domain
MNTRDFEDRPGTPPMSTGRRSFLKGSVAAAAAPMVLTSRKSAAKTVDLPPSPPVRPWAQELPARISPIEPVAALDPAPTEMANIGAGECGRGDHQRFAELAVNPLFYILRARENPEWVFNPAYPPQPVWGFQGSDGQVTAPGPTFFARYGRPVITRIYNELPQHHVGFGSPEISTHLHNAHTPSESDGFPGDFFSPLKAGPTLTAAGDWRDHFWPNVYAGVDEFGGIGDPREALGTLFYHDHCLDFTAPNVLKGQAGFYLLFDDIDSGDEHDFDNPLALRLPSHPYDYPIILKDMRFDADGRLLFDQFDPEGTLGDQICVNGRIQPVLRVARRKYRLRVLNGGPSRYYFLHLVTPDGAKQPFVYIANDGNLLPRPLYNHRKLRLAPAERADIVVDFSMYPRGTELFLVDRNIQEDTRGPEGLGRARPVLKLVVDRDPPEPDVSRIPSRLRRLRPISAAEIAAAPVRRFAFDRSKGQWTINDELFEVDRPRVIVPQRAAEVWELVNESGGWHHPVHIHFEEGRILSKRVKGVDVPTPPWERGRKDIFDLLPGGDTVTRVFVRFRDFHGKYVMHCHNIIHEDHAMMLRFDIVA